VIGGRRVLAQAGWPLCSTLQLASVSTSEAIHGCWARKEMTSHGPGHGLTLLASKGQRSCCARAGTTSHLSPITSHFSLAFCSAGSISSQMM
jgi:hypothetical protein